MDPESKKLLEETFALAQENNKMLRKIRSTQRWAAFWQTLKLLVIIGVILGSLYYIEPYLNKILDLYNSVSATQQKVSGGTNAVQDLLKNLKIK